MYFQILISICLLFSLFARAQNSCLTGNPRNMFYVDQFNKNTLDPDKDSFLAYYGQHADDPDLEKNIQIPVACTEASIAQGPTPAASSAEHTYFDSACSDRDSNPSMGRSIPCIDANISKYINWATNQAIACLSPPNDPIEPEAIFKMINHESGGKFDVWGKNGDGIDQLASGIEEVSGYNNLDYGNVIYDKKTGKITSPKKLVPYDGKAYLDKIIKVNANKKACQAFQGLLNYDVHFVKSGKYTVARVCQFLNIGDGVPRAIFYGVGLYLYYRDGRRDSANNLLNTLNLNITSREDSIKIRSWLALSLYNSSNLTEGEAGIKTLKPFLRDFFKSNHFISRTDVLKIAKDHNLIDESHKYVKDLLLLEKRKKLIRDPLATTEITAKDFIYIADHQKLIRYAFGSEDDYSDILMQNCPFKKFARSKIQMTSTARMLKTKGTSK